MPPLIARDEPSSGLTPTMTSLLTALIVLVAFGLTLVAILFMLRSHRKRQQEQRAQLLPTHTSSGRRASNHRRLTITATPFARNAANGHGYNEKEILDSPISSAPSSPIPEIRITFPEEEDASGKRKSGRVVIVKISETGGVGLEPYNTENPPSYGKDDAERFESLDLDRMGGLKEAGIDAKKP
ncbi:MAG: hypothetical protein Q9174_003442 [Haloplaca sp. 1 TL-2023]